MQDIWEPTVWSKNIVAPYVPTDIMIKREQADAGKEDTSNCRHENENERIIVKVDRHLKLLSYIVCGLN